MSCRSTKIIVLSFLVLCSSLAFSATDDEISNEFLYCAAVFNAGKAASNNPAVTQYSGRQYTKYLVSALALTSGELVKEKYSAALEKHNLFLKESANADDFGKQLSALMNSCAQTQKTYQSKVVSNVRPSQADGAVSFVANEGVTSPLDTLLSLGKPGHEDYNPDGRFTYLYPTTVGSDVYLFDRSNKLIRVAKYCDSAKAKCP